MENKTLKPKTTEATQTSVETTTEANTTGPQGSGTTTIPADQSVQATATSLSKLKLDTKRLSGAQRRKAAIEAAKAKGEPILPRKRKNEKPMPKKPTTGVPDLSTPKRQRSESKTPPSGKLTKPPLKKGKTGPTPVGEAKPSTSSEVNDGETFKQVVSALKMAVVLEQYPEQKLDQEKARLIQRAILDEVWRCEPSKGPKFTNSYFEKEVLFITCANTAAKEWLKTTIPLINPWEGAILKVGEAREILKINKAIVWIPCSDLVDVKEPKKIVELLKTQNTGLNTEEWTIINAKVEKQGTTLVLYIDEKSKKALEEANNKAYLGFFQLTFKIVK